MTEHITEIGGAKFYLRPMQGRDARLLFADFDVESGAVRMDHIMDHETVARFVIQIDDKTDNQCIINYLADMPLSDFLALVSKVYEISRITETQAKNSDSSLTSNKTRKGGEGTTVKAAKA